MLKLALMFFFTHTDVHGSETPRPSINGEPPTKYSAISLPKTRRQYTCTDQVAERLIERHLLQDLRLVWPAIFVLLLFRDRPDQGQRSKR